MNTHVLRIDVNETKHAFRVNGVTFAKRHLASTLGKETSDLEKALSKFLVIVPFLHKAFRCPANASESVKYGVEKAHRLYEALSLTDENTVPFMLVCLAQAGELPTVDGLRGMGPEVSRAFVGNNQGGDRGNVVPFAPRSRTLH